MDLMLRLELYISYSPLRANSMNLMLGLELYISYSPLRANSMDLMLGLELNISYSPLRANSMDLMAVVLRVPVVTRNEAFRSKSAQVNTKI